MSVMMAVVVGAAFSAAGATAGNEEAVREASSFKGEGSIFSLSVKLGVLISDAVFEESVVFCFFAFFFCFFFLFFAVLGLIAELLLFVRSDIMIKWNEKKREKSQRKCQMKA